MNIDVSTTSRFRPGDVLRYTPSERHCREGVAIVDDAGMAFDTYWAGGNSRLSDSDLSSADVLFNLDDFRELAPYVRYTFDRYAQADRAQVTSQRGHRQRLFVRLGALEDRATIIANAHQVLEDAEEAREAAERKVTYAREALDRIEAGHDY